MDCNLQEECHTVYKGNMWLRATYALSALSRKCAKGIETAKYRKCSLRGHSDTGWSVGWPYRSVSWLSLHTFLVPVSAESSSHETRSRLNPLDSMVVCRRLESDATSSTSHRPAYLLLAASASRHKLFASIHDRQAHSVNLWSLPSVATISSCFFIPPCMLAQPDVTVSDPGAAHPPPPRATCLSSAALQGAKPSTDCGACPDHRTLFVE